jgi:hypothetical protein
VVRFGSGGDLAVEFGDLVLQPTKHLDEPHQAGARRVRNAEAGSSTSVIIRSTCDGPCGAISPYSARWQAAFATADVASAIDAFARRIEELKRVPDLHQPNTG